MWRQGLPSPRGAQHAAPPTGSSQRTSPPPYTRETHQRQEVLPTTAEATRRPVQTIPVLKPTALTVVSGTGGSRAADDRPLHLLGRRWEQTALSEEAQHVDLHLVETVEVEPDRL